MRRYEMMIILDPSLEERTVQPSLDQFLKVVTTAGGTVDKVDVWGRRRLSYEIDKKAEGIYTVIDLTAEPDAVKELEDRQSRHSSTDANIALIYVGLGDRDQAMVWLDKAYQARFNPSILLRPAFDPLRSDVRFQDLLRRIGLPPAKRDLLH